MFRFTTSSMLLFLGSGAVIFVLSLFLAYRDTKRDFGDVFELRALRNFFRSILGYRPQRTFPVLIFATTILPAIVLSILSFTFPGLAVVAVGFGFLLLVVCPVLFWFFREAFVPDWRRRRQEPLEVQREPDTRPDWLKKDVGDEP